jgi:hypothetical protein
MCVGRRFDCLCKGRQLPPIVTERLLPLIDSHKETIMPENPSGNMLLEHWLTRRFDTIPWKDLP